MASPASPALGPWMPAQPPIASHPPFAETKYHPDLVLKTRTLMDGRLEDNHREGVKCPSVLNILFRLLKTTSNNWPGSTGLTYLSANLPQKVYFLELIRLLHLPSFRKLVSVIICQESCGKIPRKFELCASWHDHDLLDNICSEFLMTFSCEGKKRKAEITKVPFKVKLPSLHI